MIYLDYSATTPVNEEVINTYSRVCREFIGNPNSLHKLGIEAKKIIDASTMQIANILGVKQSEIIYTSGASEANNLAIKGVTSKYKNRGKHIITTELEHSSIIAPLNYLQEEGYDIDFVKLDDNGLVDLDDLESTCKMGKKDKGVLFTIGTQTFNPQYVKNVIDVLGTNVKIYFQGEYKPLFFVNDKNEIGLVLPIKKY